MVPDVVVEVTPSAFEHAEKLVSINFNNVKQLEARKEYIYDEEPYFEGTGWAGFEKSLVGIVYHSLFENCPSVGKIELPHMEFIGEFALSGLEKLRSITLPVSLTVCSNFAFYDSAIETLTSYGTMFNSILHHNGKDIIYSDKKGKRIDINPDDLTNNLCNLHQIVLYDKDTLNVKRAMYTLSKLSNITEITFSTPFIASLMREIYSKYLFADKIKDLGIEGDSINRITVVCFHTRKGLGRPNNFGVEMLLSDKDFLMLEKLKKQHSGVGLDANIIQKYAPDLYNTILNYVINKKKGDESIERMEVRIEI